FENSHGRRCEKDGEERAGEFMVVLAVLANRRRALHIDVEENVFALPQFAEDFGFEGAVAVTKNGGVFEEIAGLNAPEKSRRIEKIIIDGLLLAGARGASGAGDGA